MTSVAAGTAFRDHLLEHGVLVDSGVPGLYGRSGDFENVVDGIERFVTRMGRAEKPEVWRFPPIMNRAHLGRSGYLNSFPQLAGCVHSFDGGTTEHFDLMHHLDVGEEWANGLPPTEVALTPAACYPVYPIAAGVLPEGGRLFDVMSFCFRHEPSADPARMQSFRQREYVRLGTPDEVRAFRDLWLARAQEMLASLGLQVRADLANDAFFGKRGKMLAATQRDQSLKFEILAPVADADELTAIASCNYHLDHLSGAFGVYTAPDELAHTACVGFGLERITLALFAAHGPCIHEWPAEVRDVLGVNTA
jgi:seryl-tRNA synthetase